MLCKLAATHVPPSDRLRPAAMVSNLADVSACDPVDVAGGRIGERLLDLEVAVQAFKYSCPFCAPYGCDEVEAWLRRNCKELTQEQYALVQRVADRCLTETTEDYSDLGVRSEPLRWITHGKPGVGKSIVIRKVVKFFEECLGYTRGAQFHVCTFQAALAATLDGETCHHVAGVRMRDGKTILFSTVM